MCLSALYCSPKQVEGIRLAGTASLTVTYVFIPESHLSDMQKPPTPTSLKHAQHIREGTSAIAVFGAREASTSVCFTSTKNVKQAQVFASQE